MIRTTAALVAALAFGAPALAQAAAPVTNTTTQVAVDVTKDQPTRTGPINKQGRKVRHGHKKIVPKSAHSINAGTKH